jgi:hypothetical protein
MSVKFLKYCIQFSLVIIFISCNAPRNNPLDPENSSNNLSTIEGYVKTVKVPQSAIENANIYWINSGIISHSNNQGYFQIPNVERKDGWLTIEKNGYSTDSILISFNNQKKITEDIFLNAAPIIEHLQFYSVTINKYPSSQKYNLEVRASITDEENDIDSVFFENSELKTNKQLLYNASTRYYENSITLEDLNITSIDVVIGKDFKIIVLDVDSKKFEIGTSNIKRIIKEEILTTAPTGKDTVDSGNPLLEWKRFIPGFDFKYILEIYTDEVPAILIWQKEINPSEIQFQTNANLSRGDYFWVIWAIDEFGNRTRSKPSSFVVN